MKMKLIVASLLAAASVGAMAADQLVTLNANPLANNFFESVKAPGDGVLSGGYDKISFDGLASGVYNIVITLSGQQVTFDGTLSNLNGTTGTAYSFGQYRFFGVTHSGTGPFALNLYGTADGIGAKYNGSVTVSPVPEPATYGMLLGGLGILGFIARRRKNNNA